MTTNEFYSRQRDTELQAFAKKHVEQLNARLTESSGKLADRIGALGAEIKIDLSSLGIEKEGKIEILNN